MCMYNCLFLVQFANVACGGLDHNYFYLQTHESISNISMIVHEFLDHKQHLVQFERVMRAR